MRHQALAEEEGELLPVIVVAEEAVFLPGNHVSSTLSPPGGA